MVHYQREKVWVIGQGDEGRDGEEAPEDFGVRFFAAEKGQDDVVDVEGLVVEVKEGGFGEERDMGDTE